MSKSGTLSNRVFVPSDGPLSWRALLADPERQWKEGRSAMALAECWEASGGALPEEVASLFATHAATQGARLVLALPELKVGLPGGSRPTQTDVFALIRTTTGLAACAVEGKVDEDFGPTVEAKRLEGAADRLAALHQLLQLPDENTGSLRYQLIHRTAAAILLAQEFGAAVAAMVVHSFSADHSHYDDFEAFTKALGAESRREAMLPVGIRGGVQLFLGWTTGAAALRPRQES